MSDITNPTSVRLFCARHKCTLENIGSGSILYPTNDLFCPEPDKDGWFEFDMSEYSCPNWTEDNDCSESYEVQAK